MRTMRMTSILYSSGNSVFCSQATEVGLCTTYVGLRQKQGRGTFACARRVSSQRRRMSLRMGRMARSKPKRVTMKLDALRADVSEFRKAMLAIQGNSPMRWIETIDWIGAREEHWLRDGLISEGAFDYAVVILNREYRADIAFNAEISSHLVALCHPDFDRRLRSDWSRAVANVLRGRLTVKEAAQRGVTKTAAQIRRTRAAKAEAEARRSAPLDNDQARGPTGGSSQKTKTAAAKAAAKAKEKPRVAKDAAKIRPSVVEEELGTWTIPSPRPRVSAPTQKRIIKSPT